MLPRAYSFQVYRGCEFPESAVKLKGRESMATILVVDDDKTLADTLALILRANAYDVTVAYDGRHGYNIARTLQPDLVISDIVMPEMNGVEMAIQITRECSATKILLVSGQASTLDLLKASRDRGYDFSALTKPVYPNELLARVKALIREASAAGRRSNS